MKKKAPSFSLTRLMFLLSTAGTLAAASGRGPHVASANPLGDVGSSVALAWSPLGAGLALGNRKALWWDASSNGLSESLASKAVAWGEKTFDPQVSFSPQGTALGCTPGGVVGFVSTPTHHFTSVASPQGWDWSRGVACASLGGSHVAMLDVDASRNTPRLRIAWWPASTLPAPFFAQGMEVASVDLGPHGFSNASDAAGARLMARAGTPHPKGFWLVAASGRVVLISAKTPETPHQETLGGVSTPWDVSPATESESTRPLPLESTTAVTAYGDLLLRAGDEGVFLYTASAPLSGTRETVSAPPKKTMLTRTRLPINPCSKNERCGVSLAPDNSWFVCGSWGCFLGKGTAFRRINLPSLGEETGTLSVAHTGEFQGNTDKATARFAYFGVRDADIGDLPSAPTPVENRDIQERTKLKFKTNPDSEEKILTRRQHSVVGWTKPQFSTPKAALENARQLFSSQNVLFPYSARKRFGAVVLIADARKEKATVNTFAAWETAQEFAPPPMGGATPQARAPFAQEKAPPWWRKALQVEDALATLSQNGLTLSSVKVGIVDSGIEWNHPSFDGVLSTDNYDFVDEDELPEDGFGHGTHVASLVNSRTLEEFSSASAHFGVAPNAELIIARALDNSGRSDSIGLARALAHVAKKGARVVNCSWGGGPETQLLRDAFAHLQSEGIFVASSAGNDSLDTDKHPQVPKKFPGVVNTAASTPAGKRARFSSYGKESVFFYAPGENILGALPGGQLGEKSGTSMASPLTAGVAALLLGAGANLESTLSFLCQGATKEAELMKTSRCGLLNASGATNRFLQTMVESLGE